MEDGSARRRQRDHMEQELRRIFDGAFRNQTQGDASLFDLRGAATINITIVNNFDDKTGDRS